MEVILDCPVCFSGNYFEIGDVSRELQCDDCGFLLARESGDTQVPDRCIVCDSDSFYYASPFGMRFLGRDSICYVCETRYKNARINNPEAHFSFSSSERAQLSTCAQELKKRASHWH